MKVKLFCCKTSNEIEKQINAWFEGEGKGRRIVKTNQSESSKNITISIWHCNPRPGE